MNISNPYAKINSLALQHISYNEMKYMTNNHLTTTFFSTSLPTSLHPSFSSPVPSTQLSSLCLSVYRGILKNTYVEAAQMTYTYAPFLTYLKRDDTYDTLCERIEGVIGGVIWSKTKLAFVCDREIHAFLTPTSSSSSLPSNTTTVPINPLIPPLPGSTTGIHGPFSGRGTGGGVGVSPAESPRGQGEGQSGRATPVNAGVYIIST